MADLANVADLANAGGPPSETGAGTEADPLAPMWLALAEERSLGGALRRGAKAMVARWLLRGSTRGPSAGAASPSEPSDGATAVTGRSRATAWPRTQDEGTHPDEGRTGFRESFTFAAIVRGEGEDGVGDPPDLGLVARIERLAGRKVHRPWLAVLTPSGTLALPAMHARGWGALDPGGGHGDDPWQVGGIAVDCLVPLKTWALRFSGGLLANAAAHPRPTAIELVFEADAPPFVPGADDDPTLVSRHLGAIDWDLAAVRRLRGRSRGYLQFGTVTGVVDIGDGRRIVRAAAVREHVWGPAPDPLERGFQLLWLGGDGRRLFVQRARFPPMRLDSGVIWDRGAQHGVRELSGDASAGEGDELELAVTDEAGVARDLRARIDRRIELAIDDHRVTLALVRGVDGVGLLARRTPVSVSSP